MRIYCVVWVQRGTTHSQQQQHFPWSSFPEF